MKQAGTVVGCAFYEVVCSYLLVSIIIDVSYISMNICTNLSARLPRTTSKPSGNGGLEVRLCLYGIRQACLPH